MEGSDGTDGRVEASIEADAEVEMDAFAIKEWQFEARLVDITFIFQACKLAPWSPGLLCPRHAIAPSSP
jgi:hypothetical protein